MKMEVVINLLSETNVSYQQLTDLLHAAFEERLEQGLNFTCSTMSAEQFEAKMKDGYVFVALNKETNELLGTVTIHVGTDKSGNVFGYHEYLAVSPKVKHLGVGTKLALAWDALLKEKKAKYVLSDTACGATSSVNWHLKNGFQIYELESYRSTNYWSYVFIKYLDDSIRKSLFQIRMHYWWSWLFIRTTRHKNGSDTAIGKLYKKVKCKN